MAEMAKMLRVEPFDGTRETLHGLACSFVEEEFQKTGSVEPTWLVGRMGSVAWLETPWRSDAFKRFTIATFRDFFAKTGVETYASIVEAWAFNSDIVPEEEKAGLLAIIKEEGLENIPDKYRDDVVMVTSFDRADNHLLTRYKVTIRKRGLNFLGPRVDSPFGDDVFHGRMWNLLQPEEDRE